MLPRVRKTLSSLLRVPFILVLFALPAHSACLSEDRYTPFMVYHDGMLFAQVSEGRYSAIDVGLREVAWSFHDQNLCGFLAPVFHGNYVVLLAETKTHSSQVIALDKSTGKPLWRHPFEDLARNSSPITCGENVIVNDFVTGLTLALQAETGTVSWDTKDSQYHFFHPPAVLGTELYYMIKEKGADRGLGIAVLDCSRGTVLRILPVEDTGVSAHPILLHKGNAILIKSHIHEATVVSLFNLSEQKKIWETKTPDIFGTGLPIITDERLVSALDGIGVVDLKTGRVLLHHLTKGSVQPFAWREGFVFFHEYADYTTRTLNSFQVDPPRIAWKMRLPERIASNVVLCGDVLCVQTVGAKLALVDPTNGKLLDYIPLIERQAIGSRPVS